MDILEKFEKSRRFDCLDWLVLSTDHRAELGLDAKCLIDIECHGVQKVNPQFTRKGKIIEREVWAYKDGQVIEKYESIIAAARELSNGQKQDSDGITAAIATGRECLGFQWAKKNQVPKKPKKYRCAKSVIMGGIKYNSLSEAGRVVGVSKAHIWNAIKNGYKIRSMEVCYAD